jgi:hypothetical protein
VSEQILCIKDTDEGFEKNHLYDVVEFLPSFYNAENEDGDVKGIYKVNAVLAKYPFSVKCVDNSKFQKGYTIGQEYPVIAETEKEYYIKSNKGNIHGLKKSRFEKINVAYTVPTYEAPKSATPEVVKEKIVYVDRPVYKTVEKPVYIDRIVPTPVAKTTVSNIKDEKIINKNEKGGVIMNNLTKMFGEFGKVAEGEVALTLAGSVAVKRRNGDYVRYNTETQQIENQMDMTFGDASDMLFVMPVQEVAEGDIIKVRKGYFQVLSVLDNNNLKVVDIKNGRTSTIIKEVNLFGMGFWSKVVSLFNMAGTQGGTGAINPMMLMLMSDKNGESGFDMKDMLMMQAMGGATGTGNTGFNPMMLMLMKDGKGFGGSDMKDMLMLQAMSGGQFNLGGMFGAVTPAKATPKVVESKDTETVTE